MNYIFSAKSNAFYPVSMQADYEEAGSWPSDGIEVSDDDFNLYSGYPPEGKILSADKNGLPVWVDKPAPSKEQLIAEAESTRELNISTALQSISLLQLKLQAGRKLTDAQSAQVNSVLDYVDALEAVDTSKAPDITWPVGP
ncbi:tail assembly chaperone gp38 [Enterobacter hormaechei]|nr:tail assembly chaperone gp38 [Enterobacter hormaechei]